MMKKYTRKDFLKKGAMAAVAGSTLMAGCSPGEVNQTEGSANINLSKTYRWKMVTTWLKGFPVLGEGAEMFADWVKKMSGGRLIIKVYGMGELVSTLGEVFDAVSSGAADMGSGAGYYWAGKIPAAQFFSTVPFGMNAQQMNAWLYAGGGLELWEELYAPFNLIPFPGGNTGVQMGGWFRREIKSISDLKGLKMRIPGLGGKVLEKAGGNPVLVPGSEIYSSLEKGNIDATEWIGPYHDYKKGFPEIAEYYYTPGWHEPGTTLELSVNKKRFESLPEDLQEIVRSAASRVNSWVLSQFEAQNGSYLRKIREEHPSVKVLPFPKDVLDQLRALTREVITELTTTDAQSKKIYDAYRKFQDTGIQWSGFSERLYYNNLQS